jgi:hypothetical protein
LLYGNPAKESKVKVCGRILKDFARLGGGYFRYLWTDRNDATAYYAMRRLYCVTRGRTNDALALLHRVTHRPYPVDLGRSLIANLDGRRVAEVVRQLDTNGYYNFGKVLSDEDCQALTDFALRTPFQVLREQGMAPETEMRCFDPANPVGLGYHARGQDLMEQPDAQRIVGDPGLLAVAQGYFRSKAVQDLVAMWWSVPGVKANTFAAQLYHFDMDRVKFLKFFFYLTDVGDQNGPHCFISGTHRDYPWALRQDRRLADEEVFACVDRKREVVFTGPRGTLIAEDTRGLHKGLLVRSGHRLVFQVEYAINLFGNPFPPIHLNDRFTPEFRRRVQQYPYTFANYLGGELGEGR